MSSMEKAGIHQHFFVPFKMKSEKYKKSALGNCKARCRECHKGFIQYTMEKTKEYCKNELTKGLDEFEEDDFLHIHVWDKVKETSSEIKYQCIAAKTDKVKTLKERKKPGCLLTTIRGNCSEIYIEKK